MGNFTQVGWVTLDADKVFTNCSYECAAWSEDVLVKAGRYPVRIYGLRFMDDGRIDYSNGGVYITLPGTIVSDYFPTLYCGVPVGGEYDTKKNAGRASEYHYHMQDYSFAEKVCNGGRDDYLGGTYELFPEYEARVQSRSVSEYDGHEIVLHSIYRKGAC